MGKVLFNNLCYSVSHNLINKVCLSDSLCTKRVRLDYLNDKDIFLQT